MTAAPSRLKSAPDVFCVPAGVSFADALARGILDRAGPGALPLSDWTVLLPNRRAGRIVREAFLRLSGGRAALLPRLLPYGDIDADEVSLLLSASGFAAQDIPPAIPGLERQILLARAVMKTGMASTFDQAASLAAELARFLDEAQTEEKPFSGLASIVPEAFSDHWRQTLDFLKILTEHWPAILAERGLIDPARRRVLLLRAQIQAWTQDPPQGPVVAVGPALAAPALGDLLGLAARLPRGHLLLSGLDRDMDEESWAQIEEDHPQQGLKRLLSRLSVARADVRAWDETPAPNPARARLLAEALRPAGTTDRWRDLKSGDVPPAALEGFDRIVCDTPQEEAEVIALLLREALETPGRTAALVTPDRRLARRVACALARWDIRVDDTAGQPLTDFPVGGWLRLVARLAEERLAPVALLAALKHPFMAAGRAPDDVRRAAWALDRLALRGPRPAPDFEGLREAVRRIEPREAEAAGRLLILIEDIEARLKDFAGLMADATPKPFADLLSAHLRAAEALAATDQESGADRLWAGTAGEAASAFLSDLLAAAREVPDLKPSEYGAVLGAFLKSATVRSQEGLHPRLAILGQVEARLYAADLVIAGGLNEGAWPALPPQDPWMSRPMRRQFGLPVPERLVGMSAHDFVHAASAPRVVLTRARKVDGAPTVPARWLFRLDAVMKAAGMDWPVRAAAVARQWVRDLDAPAVVQPVARPAPRPPVSARPRVLSVTQIEAWMRDPYQVYARKILGLTALDPLDADPAGPERGVFIHAALESFVRAFPDKLPEDAEEKLIGFGRAALAALRVPPEVEAFWWPRFERMAGLFVAQERAWRIRARPVLTETTGRWTFASSGGDFTVTGKADRIDALGAGAYAVIDYKSGEPPGKGEVERGISPQLPLEALIVAKGGFDGVKGVASELVYWRVTGGGKAPVSQKIFTGAEVLAAQAEDGLRALVASFDQAETPYRSQPRATALPRFSDYDHLARVREWSVAGGEGGEG